MVGTVIGWALVVVSGLLFFTALAAFLHPPWFRDPKTGKVPPRWKLFLTAWIAPIFPAALGLALLL